MQAPPSHVLPALHWASVVHEVGQTLASQRKLPAHWTTPQTPLVPPVFDAEHAMQTPSQASSQQTPSTQKPEPHSSSTTHALPFAFGPWHCPPMQTLPWAQSVPSVQAVRQAVPLQA